MDLNQLIASVANSAIWASVVIVFIVLMRRQFAALLARMQKVTFPGGGKATFEKALQDLREHSTDLEFEQQKGDPKEPSKRELDEWELKTANSSPEWLIAVGAGELDAILGRIRETIPSLEGATIKETLQYLSDRKAISSKVQELYDNIAAMRAQVVHGDYRPTVDETMEFNRTVKLFIRRMSKVFDKLKIDPRGGSQ